MPLDARTAAARVVGDVLGGKSLNQVLPPARLKVDERDRPLLQQLCYGTVRHAPKLQALLKPLLKRPLKAKDSDIQGLLLCGLYQLEHLDTPEHAAVAASVDAARFLKKTWAGGLVNAVLRRFLRERETLTASLDEAANASHPAWLYGKIRQQWPRQSAAIVTANNQQPPMTLRVNHARVTSDAYLAQLQAAGIEANAGSVSPQAITLAQPMDVHALPGFDAGEVSVQDEAAQAAALLLGAEAGERVLDACAAPGGKSCHVLELQPQLSELVALDVDSDRLEKVAENLARLKLNATVCAGDAAAPPELLTQDSFDRILVDAPCSASGVIRRHPDVKLLRRYEDLAGFAQQQLAILDGVWPLLKNGGTLLYATCSIFDEENSAVIEQFLGANTDASLDEIVADWGEARGPGRQLLPNSQGSDGLFYARLKKTRGK